MQWSEKSKGIEILNKGESDGIRFRQSKVTWGEPRIQSRFLRSARDVREGDVRRREGKSIESFGDSLEE